jgi:hypothetical protein
MLLVVSAGTGCRDEEQGRKLSFTKGKYAGGAVPPVSAQAQKELQERTQKLWKEGGRGL